MPIKWDTKIILAEIESSYGVDPTPVGADGILAKDVSLTPMEGNDVDRDLELPFLGSQGTVPVELHAKVSFKVELAPSGVAGTAPGWGKLFRACSNAETIAAGVSVTYNPITDGQESITMYVWIGETLYSMVGTRGNCSIEYTTQNIPYLMFDFTGLFVPPSETTRVLPDLSSFQKPQVVTTINTTSFSLNAVDMVMRKVMFDLGNQVETRFLVGSEGVLITDKAETIETTVEAVPLTAFDPYDLALNQTDMVLSLVHGTGVGRIATLAVPKAQMQRPQGLENAQNITEWSLRMAAIPNAGNDQWTLTLT